MTFGDVLITFLTHPLTKFIIVLIIGNVLAGIIVDIKEGVFHWDQQADFLKTIVLPYVGGALILQMILWASTFDILPPGLTDTAVWTIVIVVLVARLGRLLKTLIPQLPIAGEPAISTDTSTTSRNKPIAVDKPPQETEEG